MKILVFTAYLLLLSCSFQNSKNAENIPKNLTDEIAGVHIFPTINHLGVKLGGFSGLSYKDGFFYTMTDRGPNSEAMDVDGDNIEDRVFLNPNFSPVILKFKIENKKIDVHEIITLKKDNKPLSGIPNLDKEQNPSFYDERPFNAEKKRLPNDPNGLDPEGISIDPNNNIWLSEEYGPSLFQFNSKGEMLTRIVPINSKRNGIEKLPSFLNNKKLNRGFEGLCFYNGKLYTIIQSPIPSQKKNRMIHIFEFDINLKALTGHYLYKLNKKGEKIGALTHMLDYNFLVIEQDGDVGKKSFKKIFKIDLAQATNLIKNWDDNYLNLSFKKLKKKNILPVNKQEVLDLNHVGFSEIEKIEGLHYLNQELYILIDNDFELRSNTPSFLVKTKLN